MVTKTKKLAKTAAVKEVIQDPEKSSPYVLTGATYDFFKKLAQLVLPAAGALYFALAQIWGLPGAERVIGTIAAVNVFFGALVHVSASNYNKSDARFDGSIDVDQTDTLQKFSLNLNSHPDDLADKDIVTFKVNK